MCSCHFPCLLNSIFPKGGLFFSVYSCFKYINCYLMDFYYSLCYHWSVITLYGAHFFIGVLVETPSRSLWHLLGFPYFLIQAVIGSPVIFTLQTWNHPFLQGSLVSFSMWGGRELYLETKIWVPAVPVTVLLAPIINLSGVTYNYIKPDTEKEVPRIDKWFYSCLCF